MGDLHQSTQPGPVSLPPVSGHFGEPRKEFPRKPRSQRGSWSIPIQMHAHPRLAVRWSPCACRLMRRGISVGDARAGAPQVSSGQSRERIWGEAALSFKRAKRLYFLSKRTFDRHGIEVFWVEVGMECHFGAHLHPPVCF